MILFIPHVLRWLDMVSIDGARWPHRSICIRSDGYHMATVCRLFKFHFSENFIFYLIFPHFFFLFSIPLHIKTLGFYLFLVVFTIVAKKCYPNSLRNVSKATHWMELRTQTVIDCINCLVYIRPAEGRRSAHCLSVVLHIKKKRTSSSVGVSISISLHLTFMLWARRHVGARFYRNRMAQPNRWISLMIFRIQLEITGSGLLEVNIDLKCIWHVTACVRCLWMMVYSIFGHIRAYMRLSWHPIHAQRAITLLMDADQLSLRLRVAFFCMRVVLNWWNDFQIPFLDDFDVD